MISFPVFSVWLCKQREDLMIDDLPRESLLQLGRGWTNFPVRGIILKMD